MLSEYRLGRQLHRSGSGAVFVAEDGTSRLRSVEIGRMNDLSAEILNGLSVSDEVLLHPNERIEDGIPVVRLRTAAQN